MGVTNGHERNILRPAVRSTTRHDPPLTAAQQELVVGHQGMAHWYWRKNWSGLVRWIGIDEMRGFALLFLCEAAVRFEPDRPAESTGEPVKFRTFLVTHLHLRFRKLRADLLWNREKFPQIRESDFGGRLTEPDLLPIASAPSKSPDAVAVLAGRDDRRKSTRQVEEFLRVLPARLRFIVEARFGLLDGREWTLEEVGDALGVTRERVRQLQEKAMKRLDRCLDTKVPAGTRSNLEF